MDSVSLLFIIPVGGNWSRKVTSYDLKVERQQLRLLLHEKVCFLCCTVAALKCAVPLSSLCTRDAKSVANIFLDAQVSSTASRCQFKRCEVF